MGRGRVPHSSRPAGVRAVHGGLWGQPHPAQPRPRSHHGADLVRLDVCAHGHRRRGDDGAGHGRTLQHQRAETGGLATQ